MRLSPSFVYLAIALLAANAVDAAPVHGAAIQRRTPSPLGSSGVADASLGRQPNVADVNLDASGKSPDVVGADVNLCKENLLGIVGPECSDNEAVQDHRKASEGSDSQSALQANVGGKPNNNGRTNPVNVAVLNYGPHKGDGASQGNAEDVDSNGASQGKEEGLDVNDQQQGSSHKSSGGQDTEGARPSSYKNSQDDDKAQVNDSHQPSDKKHSSSVAAKHHQSGQKKHGHANKTSTNRGQEMDSNTTTGKGHPKVDIKLNPAKVTSGKTQSAIVAAHKDANAAKVIKSNSNNNDDNVNVDGSANGGSVDCSSHGGILGLSSLNINSCNGGNGGKNIVGGSSSDNHRQGLIGLLRRRSMGDAYDPASQMQAPDDFDWRMDRRMYEDLPGHEPQVSEAEYYDAYGEEPKGKEAVAEGDEEEEKSQRKAMQEEETSADPSTLHSLHKRLGGIYPTRYGGVGQSWGMERYAPHKAEKEPSKAEMTAEKDEKKDSHDEVAVKKQVKSEEDRVQKREPSPQEWEEIDALLAKLAGRDVRPESDASMADSEFDEAVPSMEYKRDAHPKLDAGADDQEVEADEGGL